MGREVRAVVEVEGDEQVHGVIVGIDVGAVQLQDYALVVLAEKTRLLCGYACDDRLLSVGSQVTRQGGLIGSDYGSQLGMRELAGEQTCLHVIHYHLYLLIRTHPQSQGILHQYTIFPPFPFFPLAPNGSTNF
jgi:hypothetical protein